MCIRDSFKVGEVNITYIKNTSLEKAIDRVFVEVDKRYHEGALAFATVKSSSRSRCFLLLSGCKYWFLKLMVFPNNRRDVRK